MIILAEKLEHLFTGNLIYPAQSEFITKIYGRIVDIF